MIYTPEKAAELICSGHHVEGMQVNGRLDLTEFSGERLPEGLHCYELDASGSRVRGLPENIQIDGRLVLDNCQRLRSLPKGLTAGSISLRNCSSLETLPEKLSTWFLDLTACSNFASWPKEANINRGALVLRNCTSIASLPSWLGRLSQLDLGGCVQIQEIPNGVSVSSWVDIGGTGIRSLPPSMEGATLRWRGVRINERIAFSAEELTSEEALAEKNAEVRRVIIERMGYLRFAAEAKAEILDEDKDRAGQRQLLKINLQEDEPLVGLSCICPSTARQYFLRVPPTMKSCHQAAAWIAGYDDPDLYSPIIET
jgi:hypothetical protein